MIYNTHVQLVLLVADLELCLPNAVGHATDHGAQVRVAAFLALDDQRVFINVSS